MWRGRGKTEIEVKRGMKREPQPEARNKSRK
jgi:hypothetical protein